jgi:DNA-binding HxlR family transcriptional regulator
MKRVKEDRLNMQRIDVGCARRTSLAIEILFQGKWKAQILCAMRSGPIRLGQLARIIPGASKKRLTQNLRRLEADGIVVRKDLTDLVLHIEYDLADSAREAICDLLDQMVRWSDLYLKNKYQRFFSFGN